MTMEDGRESPDFFFDNQSLEVKETQGKKEILTTYCLGRSIYRVTHDGKAYKVTRHADGYAQARPKSYIFNEILFPTM